MRISARSVTLVSFLGVLLSACSPNDETNLEEKPENALTYHQDAKPILERYCTGCHTEGGIANFALTDYANAQRYAPLMAGEVESGDMPPWPPGDDSLPLRYPRKMEPQHKKILLDWLKGGAKEGDAATPARVTIIPPVRPAPPRADLVLDMGVTYQPDKKLHDDYRCFVIDPNPSGTGGMPQDSWVRAGVVKPGNAAIDHHVIVYAIPADKAAMIKKKDADEAGPGYSCLGGPGTWSASFVIGWAPGGVAVRLSDNEGMPVKKGTIFVMQMHYNVHNDDGKGDRTTAELEIVKSAPPYLVYQLPLADPDRLKIPANDPDAIQSIVAPVRLILQQLKLPGNDLTIVSVTPHMHLLGTRIDTLVGSQPLVAIPKWDFHWQQSYQLTEPFVAGGNQSLILECHYNNTAENQPVIDGMRRTPKDITWGEGTEDEMCLSFVGIRFPRPMP